MALTQHWKLDDNAASTTVVATVGTNGTLLGGDNTSVKYYTATTPGTGIIAGFDLNATDDAVDISGSSISFASGEAWSALAWCQFDAAGSSALIGRTGSNTSSIRKTTDTGITVVMSASAYTYTVVSLGVTDWCMVLVTHDTSNNLRVFIGKGGSVTESSTGAQTAAESFAPDRLGVRNATFLDGKIAWAKIFNSDETANAATLYAEKDLVGGHLQRLLLTGVG
jgi:hypothetical protein